MDMSARVDPAVTLVELARFAPATVSAIDWDALMEPEARRLRELGFGEGEEVEVLHRAGFGGRAGGPVACRVGRMTVGIRRSVAAAIHVRPAA